MNRCNASNGNLFACPISACIHCMIICTDRCAYILMATSLSAHPVAASLRKDSIYAQVADGMLAISHQTGEKGVKLLARVHFSISKVNQ